MKIHFERTGPATFGAPIRGLTDGTYTMLLTFDAEDYPIERHCRYMRYTGGEAPYTFPNMEFAETPPGVRVGPWPGWRGIPDMPQVTVEVHAEQIPLRFQFWGDELTRRRVRGTVTVRVAEGSECTVTSVDERLIPAEAVLYRSTRSEVDAVPVALRDELAGSHPRLLLTECDLPGLRERRKSTHRHIWERIEELLNFWDLPPAKTPESKAFEGPERLFGEDRAVITAFHALLESTEGNVDLARRAFFDYIETTERDDFEPLRIDTQCGETLFTLCICYDWLHSQLTEAEAERARQRLWEVAKICWGHLGYDRHDYAQAHFLGCGLGLLAFSFLFWETHPRAAEWASYLRGTFERVLAMLPEDGFYPHGINLWIYEYGFILRWLELFRVCAGLDFWVETAHWQNTSRFRSCATSPDFLYGVTMGDPQYRVGGDSWCHYLIAARTNSGQAQWLAEKLSDGPHAGVDFRHIPPRRRVYEFLYYDPSIPANPAAKTVHDFRDGGQVFVSSRAGEPESLFTFRSGPPIGRQRRRAGEEGAYGHADPANGSFLLFRRDTFLVSGPGPTYRRDTGLHNTITIDGQGQIGDSTVWLPDFFPDNVIPRCTEVKSDGSRALLFADLTSSYLPHLGVGACTRSMLVDLETAIVGVDTVRCSEARSIEWNLHSWRSIDELQLKVLAPDVFDRRTGLTEFVPAYPHDGTRDISLQLSIHAPNVQWVWCILLRDDLRPELVRDGGRLTVTGLPSGPIHFDGIWLTPDGFHETVT